MKNMNKKGVPISNFPLNPDHKLAKAMDKINWNSLQANDLFQKGFIPLQPIRRIFGLLILEKIRGLQGEELLQQWLETPILQYFTGEDLFHWELPISNEEIQTCRMQLSSYGIQLLNSMIEEVKTI